MEAQDLKAILFKVRDLIDEAKKGDAMDKHLALESIDKTLKENGIYMPF